MQGFNVLQNHLNGHTGLKVTTTLKQPIMFPDVMLTTNVFTWNFSSLEVVPRLHYSQLRASENCSESTK